jgi:hypothetical protein
VASHVAEGVGLDRGAKTVDPATASADTTEAVTEGKVDLVCTVEEEAKLVKGDVVGVQNQVVIYNAATA